MCPKLIELLSWNGPTIHVCCFMLTRASTKTFVSRIHIRQPNPYSLAEYKNNGKNLRQPKNSLAGSLVSRGITIFHINLSCGLRRPLYRLVPLLGTALRCLTRPHRAARRPLLSSEQSAMTCGTAHFLTVSNKFPRHALWFTKFRYPGTAT